MSYDKKLKSDLLDFGGISSILGFLSGKIFEPTLGFSLYMLTKLASKKEDISYFHKDVEYLMASEKRRLEDQLVTDLFPNLP